MAHLLIKALKLSACLAQKGTKFVLCRSASFTLRDIITENSQQTGSLFLKFSKHLAMECRQSLTVVPTTIRYANYFPITNMQHFEKELQHVDATQLPALITFTFTYRSSADPVKFAELLNKLDAHALKLLPTMNDDTILHTLYALLFLMPSWINLMNFYKASMQKLSVAYLGNVDATKDKFVQFCFYLGLNKKHASTDLLNKLLQQQLDKHLPHMTTMDVAIICNASFKSAIIIDNSAFNARLIDEILKLQPDVTHVDLLITFLKTLRLQRVKNSIICEHLKNFTANVATLCDMPVSGLTHLFAVFAENCWDEPSCIQPIVDAFLKQLSNNTVAVETQINKFRAAVAATNMRAKDVDKFLWCCAQLNFNFQPEILQIFEKILLQKLRNDEFNMFPDQLVDSCLSLWQLGYKSKTLFLHTLQLKAETTAKHHQPKVESRLTVLKTAVGIEEPTWLPNDMASKSNVQFDLTNTAPAYIMKSRQDLLEFAQKLDESSNNVDVKIICPIVGINVPSILLKVNDAQIIVELLTDTQVLRWSKVPIALLRLKIHLLKVLKHHVVVLQAEDAKKNATLEHLITLETKPASSTDTGRSI